MPKKGAIVKNCPKCEQNAAVASKSCKCGYSFFNAKKSLRSSSRTPAGSSVARNHSPSTAHDGDERRRTSRVRREKPNYYDSQEFEKKKKKKKERRGRPKTICNLESAAKLESKETTAARAKRRRLRKEQEDGGGDLCGKLSVEKQDLAALILAEINRKMCSVCWSP